MIERNNVKRYFNSQSVAPTNKTNSSEPSIEILGNIFNYCIVYGIDFAEINICIHFLIKGTFQRDFHFQPPVFSSFEPAMATDQWVKIFSILVKNSQSYQNFQSENLTLRGVIPWRVRLPGVSYPGKSISPGYHTMESQSSRGIIPLRVNLPGYHTLVSQ